jgi:CDP-diacylglycerol--serine O-phosphatidyltransferase
MLAVAIEHGELYGSILIIIAGILDRYDGKIARKLDVTSDFGKELDSLSDLVSFGLAPSLIAWHLGLRDLGWIGIVIALLFLSAGAYRLARFNIVAEPTIEYTGIPITIAGSLLSLYTIYVNLANMPDNIFPQVRRQHDPGHQRACHRDHAVRRGDGIGRILA